MEQILPGVWKITLGEPNDRATTGEMLHRQHLGADGRVAENGGGAIGRWPSIWPTRNPHPPSGGALLAHAD